SDPPPTAIWRRRAITRYGVDSAYTSPRNDTTAMSSADASSSSMSRVLPTPRPPVTWATPPSPCRLASAAAARAAGHVGHPVGPGEDRTSVHPDAHGKEAVLLDDGPRGEEHPLLVVLDGGGRAGRHDDLRPVGGDIRPQERDPVGGGGPLDVRDQLVQRHADR